LAWSLVWCRCGCIKASLGDIWLGKPPIQGFGLFPGLQLSRQGTQRVLRQLAGRLYRASRSTPIVQLDTPKVRSAQLLGFNNACMNLVASELLFSSLDFQAVIFSAFLRHKPSCSIAGQYFSNHRFPNRTGTFWRIRLSRDVAPPFLGLSPCGSRPPPHPLGSVHPPLRPFTLSWALPQAFDYYDRSATMRVSPLRWSHCLTSSLVRT
jgi:hypothetical protein